jgi:sugar porter (SP) family MFS transporter
MNKTKSPVFWWSIIVSLGGLLFGFDTAVISGVEQSIQQLFQLSDLMHGFIIASALIGTIIGSFTSGYPADKYGRKPMLFIIAGLFLVSAIGSALSTTVLQFIIFRLLGGLSIGASSVVAPMYISEISPAKVRGRMTMLFQFNIVFGITIAFFSNYLLRDTGANPWRWMLGVESVPALLYLILLFIIPQSPRFLIKIGKMDEALKVLSRVEPENIQRRTEEIQASFQNIVSREKLFVRKYSKPIFIAFLVAFFNQTTGINGILYYAPRIIENTGLAGSTSLQQAIAIGFTNLVFTFVAVFIIDRVGRKRLLLIGSVGTFIFLALTAIAFFQENFSGYNIVLYLMGFVAFFAISSGAVIWVLIAEVFPNSVRGKGQGLGSGTHWALAALITYLLPFAVESDVIGGGMTFAFFATMTFIQFFVVWRIFPETKGKSLEELENELVRKN